jgi:hypothetical protein
MSRSNPRSLDTEGDNDKGIWVARVESMSVSQINEFKQFIKRRNGMFLASRLFLSSPTHTQEKHSWTGPHTAIRDDEHGC